MKKKKKIVENQRVLFIIKSVENKDLFLTELFQALELYHTTGNKKPLEECLNEWEVTAEVDSVPGAKEAFAKVYSLIRE